MDLDGRRESTNVEDRRGMSGGAKVGLGGGIMGIIIALLAMFLGGGDLGSILGQMGQTVNLLSTTSVVRIHLLPQSNDGY